MDQDEWIDPGDCIRSRILDVPLLSLFFALLRYRRILEDYFYLPPTEQVLLKGNQSIFITICNFEFVQIRNITKGCKTQQFSSLFEKEMLAQIPT